MFKHTRAVAFRLPRLLLALALMATLAFTLTTHQAATGTTDAGSVPNATTAANSFDPVQLPLSFVSNAGQVDSAVAFQVNSLGGSLFFTPEDVVLMLPGVDQPYVVDVDFVGANANVNVIGGDQLPGIVNYFIGNDPDAWLTNIPTYAAITYDTLYSGVSLNYTGTQGVLKSAYTVASGADPSVIAWRYGGALDTRVDAETGDLHIVLDDAADHGEVILVERAPMAWQIIDGAQVSVDVGYTVSDTGTVRFELGDYDPAYALTLDPELLYSSFFGGITNDVGYAITTDTKGNVYITGETDSIIFPEEPTGIPGNDLQGGVDAFVTKINVAISSQQMVYSTYLGGSQNDYGYGIALDSSNNAYVTGQTTSPNFPSYPPTGGGYDSTKSGTSDAFVVKLNASGTGLLYSTYLGGTGLEKGNDIAVDSVGNAYVTGYTTSLTGTGFPTDGGYDTTYNGNQDAFVTKFNPSGSGVEYSTYLGGVGPDTGEGIDLYTNPGGDFAYVVGQAGTGFPLLDAHDSSFFGGSEGFLTRLNADGDGLVFSTYIGGSGAESATDLVVDQDGNAYVTGWTNSSSGFPISAGAKQSSLAGAPTLNEDAFITEYGATGGFLYGTYFGGSGVDIAYAIDLDIEGIVHFAGETSSDETTFPLEATFEDRNPLPPTWDQLTLEVAPDAFVAGFDPLDTTPGSYLYSSYLGGMNDDPASPGIEDDAADIAWGLAVDVSGGVNVVGETTSAGFPQVRDTFQRGGGTDAFIAYMSSAKADLIIDKLGNGEATEETFVSPGSPLVYTIEVRNLGPSDSHNVQIEDTVPTSKVSIDPGGITPPPGGSCSVNGSVVTCDIGTVRAPSFGNPIPDPVVVTIETTVLSGTAGQITNTVAITQSSTFDPNPSLIPEDENANAAEHIAYSVPDLELLAEADDYRVLSDPPESFQYIFSIRNTSPVTAHNIVITGLTMPPGVENPVATVPPLTTFDAVTGTWEIQSPLTNLSGTLTLTIDVDVVFGTPIGTFLPITATATADEADKNPADNTDVLVRVKVVSPYGDTGCHPSPDDPANEVLCTSD